ncbi:alcohol dehydrogenase 1-like [Lathyrus oleraceus]|nr:alcohol dehydrogenase 1-like [Pisum sativum]
MGIREVVVGIVAVFDGHNGAEASEMASKLLMEYFVLHTYFLLDAMYSVVSKTSTGKLLHRRDHDHGNLLHRWKEILGWQWHELHSERLQNVFSANFDDSFHLEILKEALLRAIHDIDVRFSEEASRNNIHSGSTATVVLVADDKFLVANIGDSKAFLCSENFQSPKEAKASLLELYRQTERDGSVSVWDRENSKLGWFAKINPDAPLDKVCILSCGICTGLGATINVAKPKPGSSVAIFGLGAVGLAAAEGARISGASRIIGVDLVSSRFELAKKFGVNEFMNPKDHDKPVQQVIAEITNGGVDRAVECTGSIQAMISAFECVHDGWGTAVLVGVPSKDDAFKTHPMNFLNERTLKGTFYGNYKPRTDLPNVVEKYMKGELELEKFITHTVPFSEINKAFDYMLKGESIRCIIRMEE